MCDVSLPFVFVAPFCQEHLGPPVLPFFPFLGEGSPTKIDYRKRKKNKSWYSANLAKLEDLGTFCSGTAQRCQELGMAGE